MKELKYLLYMGYYDDKELIGIYDSFEQCIDEICSFGNVQIRTCHYEYKPVSKKKMLSKGLNAVYYVDSKEGYDEFHFDTMYTNTPVKEYFRDV